MAETFASNDALCLCAAHDQSQSESWHSPSDHKNDCHARPPCGGCWACLGMTATFTQEARRG